MNNKDNFAEIDKVNDVIKRYCDGLYYADVEKLRDIFCECAVLKAPEIRRTREEWLALVSRRPVPFEQGEQYNYKVISLDIVGEQALVKLYCPLLGREYVDFLGLLKELGQWRIVNKMYADI
ncbi:MULTISPECIES: nuclear transport factor 2 family protein [Pseudoalteromonas]|uniref:Nuclear transport factor 2 family protein n=1 Tax=Pseudoalteromonas obscura TaxID=3048491 RepID=A0ABT7EJZ2_9GAMM|nr:MULTISPECIES: nuclear transport factor 2 family protein [Pseudoalteromonas]MBQ4836949.1 nuclear transport factor 2 family protein [Pseudoalteromonas luteoviolacea]MDK2595381.1 nuclear transport factor 2 family protein [Pseudoalteromonas sp. P94(2023)]